MTMTYKVKANNLAQAILYMKTRYNNIESHKVLKRPTKNSLGLYELKVYGRTPTERL